MTKFSILDLSPIVEGSTPGQALNNSLDLARHAERLGFNRYWVAEHHNMRGIASAATSVVICHIAGGTSTIRVGAGGIMLPNHAPLVIAEQFGTLASLFPGRIDLGIGRAPGTDQVTSMALRRNLNGSVEDFPRDLVELQHYLKPAQPGQRVIATPGEGTQVPIWILGSSLFGAQLAAMLGLPFAFASHFAPALMQEALEIYRSRFKPSEELAEPYVMLGYNVCAADTAEDAQFLRSSSVLSFLSLRKGQPRRLPPPVRNLAEQLEPLDRAILEQMNSPTAVGTLDDIASGMGQFIEDTGADELMLVCSIYEHTKRVHSFEIVAEAARQLDLVAA
ncbi:MAG: LLM class flavin-dependent oxidoreductase [Pseudomonadota bacterium]